MERTHAPGSNRIFLIAIVVLVFAFSFVKLVNAEAYWHYCPPSSTTTVRKSRIWKIDLEEQQSGFKLNNIIQHIFNLTNISKGLCSNKSDLFKDILRYILRFFAGNFFIFISDCVKLQQQQQPKVHSEFKDDSVNVMHAKFVD